MSRRTRVAWLVWPPTLTVPSDATPPGPSTLSSRMRRPGLLKPSRGWTTSWGCWATHASPPQPTVCGSLAWGDCPAPNESTKHSLLYSPGQQSQYQEKLSWSSVSCRENCHEWFVRWRKLQEWRFWSFAWKHLLDSALLEPKVNATFKCWTCEGVEWVWRWSWEGNALVTGWIQWNKEERWHFEENKAEYLFPSRLIY